MIKNTVIALLFLVCVGLILERVFIMGRISALAGSCVSYDRVEATIRASEAIAVVNRICINGIHQMPLDALTKGAVEAKNGEVRNKPEAIGGPGLRGP
jgi:hypothetical protein